MTVLWWCHVSVSVTVRCGWSCWMCSIAALPRALGQFIIAMFCIILVAPCCYFYCKWKLKREQ